MTDIINHIKTKKRTYPIVFNLNVLEEIQEQYGSLSKWGELIEGEGEPKIHDLKQGIMAMINEGIDIENEDADEPIPFVNSKQVGRIVQEVGLVEIVQAIKDLTLESTEVETSKNE